LIISFAGHTPFRGQKVNMHRRYHTEAVIYDKSNLLCLYFAFAQSPPLACAR